MEHKSLREELYDDSESLYMEMSLIQRVLGVSISTIYKMVKAGDLPGSKNINGRWFVDKKKFRDDLEIDKDD